MFLIPNTKCHDHKEIIFHVLMLAQSESQMRRNNHTTYQDQSKMQLQGPPTITQIGNI